MPRYSSRIARTDRSPHKPKTSMRDDETRIADVVDGVGHKILKHFKAVRVTLSEIDRDLGRARILKSWEADNVSSSPRDYNLSDYFSGSMIDDLFGGRLVAIDNIGADSRTAARAESYKAVSVRASLHAPFPTGGRRVFKLAVHKSEPHTWTLDEKDLCRELSASVYSSIARARGDRKLRESETRLRMATEAAEMFVWEADLAARKMMWAENTAKVIGCRPEQLTEDFSERWFFVHPDDRKRVDAEFEESILSGKQHFTVEYRGIDKDDQSTFWLAQAFMLRQDGKPVRLVGTTQNVSRQKRSEILLQQSEERLRLILDSVVDYAIITNDDKRIITGWNPGAVNVFGYETHEIIGQPVDVLFTPEDRANDVPAKEIATALKRGRAEDERWHLRKDGTRFYASGVLSPLQGGSGGYVKVARDLTVKQQAEHEQRQMKENLERRVRSRTSELAESNDALKQQVAESARAEEERVRLLRKIVTTQEDERGRIARDLHDQLGQRLTALRLKIASLKDQCGDNKELSKRVADLEALGSGIDSEVSFLAWELRPRVLDDFGLVSAVENFINEWSHHFDLPAEFHTAGLRNKRLEQEIETNLYRITQEALNNISKHAGASNASVLLERRGREVVLIIEDNGVGFDVEEKYQADGKAGSLGLIGMRERAAIVGGTIEVESAKGAGTKVFVTVPAKFVRDDNKYEN